MVVLQLLNLKFQCRLICAIPDGDIELQKELPLGQIMINDVSHLLEICHTHYAIESGATTSVCWQNHQCSSRVLSLTLEAIIEAITHSARIVHTKHPPGLWQLPCTRICLQRLFQRRAIGRSSVTPARTANLLLQWIKQLKGTHGHGLEGRESRLRLWGVHTEKPTCNEICLDDVCAPHTNEAYRTVCLPASASNKGMTSLQVKVWHCGQAEMFYHCISSNTSILIPLTR